MNKRIREIMEQCETEYSTSYEPCYDMEKFAKLIVLECAYLVEGFEMTQQFAPDVIMNFEASWVLKEQFGIEE